MENLKDELYEISNRYYNLTYDLECMEKLIAKYEDEAIQTNDREVQDVVHILKIVVSDITKKLREVNEIFDNTILKVK